MYSAKHDSKEGDDVNPQFKKGVLEMCVLCSLQDGDKYGFELISHISRGIVMAEGTVYPLLKRLRDDGLLSTYLQESSEGPPRKYYKLTQEGQKRTLTLRKEWEEFTQGVNLILHETSQERR